jgi:hypothetical protein
MRKAARGGIAAAAPKPTVVRRRPECGRLCRLRCLRLGRELAAIVALPVRQKRMQALGVIADGRGHAAFAEYQRADIARWGVVIKEAGIQPD